jgi:hypothetical protein
MLKFIFLCCSIATVALSLSTLAQKRSYAPSTKASMITNTVSALVSPKKSYAISQKAVFPTNVVTGSAPPATSVAKTTTPATTTSPTAMKASASAIPAAAVPKRSYAISSKQSVFAKATAATATELPITAAPSSDNFFTASITKVPGGEFIDADAMVAASTFAIKPADLIQLTKEVLLKGVGLDDESVLADNFEFCAPVVGPLPKEDYLGALRNFKLLDAFPDMNNRFYNIHVDPFETNRVWWFTRSQATWTGTLLGKKGDGRKLELPPQANSFTFNEAGKVTQVTVGYVLDRRVGNTGGLGGAFAYLYGTGNPLPIPECQPYKKSFRFRLLNLIGKIGKLFS